MNFEASIECEYYIDEFKTDYEDRIKFGVAGNQSLLLGFCSV